jgi:hypothetical protein
MLKNFRFHKGRAVIVIGISALASAAVVVPPLSVSSADATSTVHTLQILNNGSTDVENSVHVRFTCHALAGTGGVGRFSLKVTNINLVDGNGASFVRADDVLLDVSFQPPPFSTTDEFSMQQNATNGLWELPIVTDGIIANSNCVSGQYIAIYDDSDLAFGSPTLACYSQELSDSC